MWNFIGAYGEVVELARMRALVTGSSGFVGQFLVDHLRESGDEVAELPSSLDITDAKDLERVVGSLGPLDVVYHLAALSHVGDSWSAPERTYSVNIGGTANLCEALSRLSNKPRLVFVSSSEVYGTPSLGDLPYREDQRIRPVSPYAASKAAGEAVVLQAYFGRGVPVVIARSFNHTGPGQSPDFVASGFAKRAAVALSGNGAVEPIAVGNLEAKRDFTDVRDVVRAYRLLGHHGRSGEIYNVCSGRAVEIRTITELLSQLCHGEVRFEVDPKLVRSVEIPELYGSYQKLHRETGWEPTINFETTIADIWRYWMDSTGL